MVVEAKIDSPEKASRLEVIIRIFYGIIVAIILWFFGILAGIIFLVNIFTCLILGKRVGNSITKAYVIQHMKLSAYLMLVTDERPPLIPQF